MFVVMVHLAPGLGVGDFGVDVFFVLSGAVMAMIQAKDDTPAQFLVRRAIRIWPLYFLCTSALLLLLFFLRTDMGVGPLGPAYLQSILFIPFEMPNGKVIPLLPPGWSLNFEAFFYVLMGGMLWLAHRRAAVLSAAILIILALIGQFIDVAGATRIYTSPLLLHFSLGIAVWFFRPRHALVSPRTFLLIAAGCFAAMCFLQHQVAPGLRAALNDDIWPRVILYGPFAALLTWTALGTDLNPSESRWLGRLVKTGDESYATYLTHMFVVYAAMRVWPVDGRTGLQQATVLIVGMPLALTLGFLVHQFVDDPLQRRLRASVVRSGQNAS